MKIIDEIYTRHPYYGTRRMSKYLQSKGYATGRKVIRRYYRIMRIEAVYPKMNLKVSKRRELNLKKEKLKFLMRQILLPKRLEE